MGDAHYLLVFWLLFSCRKQSMGADKYCNIHNNIYNYGNENLLYKHIHTYINIW